MTLKEKLDSFKERFERERFIVILDKRSYPLDRFWLNEYGSERHQIQIKKEWEKAEVTEEKHYIKDGHKCISLEV